MMLKPIKPTEHKPSQIWPAMLTLSIVVASFVSNGVQFVISTNQKNQLETLEHKRSMLEADVQHLKDIAQQCRNPNYQPSLQAGL